MALITVYDPDGKPLTVEPVDARELLKFGGYTANPPEKPAEEIKDPGAPEDQKQPDPSAEQRPMEPDPQMPADQPKPRKHKHE